MRPSGRRGWGLGQKEVGCDCQRREEGPAPTSADPVPSNSVIIPEKLDSFINKFAEYTHEKWAFDKVGVRNSFPGTPTPASKHQLF